MSVTVDTPSGPSSGPPPGPPPGQLGGSGRRWLAVAVAMVVAVLVTTVLFKVVNRPADGEAPVSGTAKGAPLRDELSARVAAILERSTPTDHTAHGHHLGDEPGQVVCSAEVYGYEPANATKVDDVERAVGYHLCGVVVKGRTWDYAVKLVGPLAVEFADPPSVRVAESGTGYPDRVRQVVGDRYFDQAMRGFSPGRDIDIRDRYNDLARSG